MVRKCAAALVASFVMLCQALSASPVQALTVTYDYMLSFTSIDGAVEQSPFDLSDESAQLSGTMAVAFSEDGGQASVVDNSFVISWDNGFYSSGGATDTAFSEFIIPDGQWLDVFFVRDNSTYDAFGDFNFDLLNLGVVALATGNEADEEDYFYETLDDAAINSFYLRFSNGSETLNYSGVIAFLEPSDILWEDQQALSAVPLPSSAASLIAGFALFGFLRAGRRRRQLGQAA